MLCHRLAWGKVRGSAEAGHAGARESAGEGWDCGEEVVTGQHEDLGMDTACEGACSGGPGHSGCLRYRLGPCTDDVGGEEVVHGDGSLNEGDKIVGIQKLAGGLRGALRNHCSQSFSSGASD